MAEPTVITWTPANWITVGLMVALFYFGAVAVWKVIQTKTGSAS